MPLFDFRCENCNEVHETLVFRDEAIYCPLCDSGKVVKLISRPGKPIFKGPGFFATDYPKKKDE